LRAKQPTRKSERETGFMKSQNEKAIVARVNRLIANRGWKLRKLRGAWLKINFGEWCIWTFRGNGPVTPYTHVKLAEIEAALLNDDRLKLVEIDCD
jgi:hypothetical protein